MQHSIISWDCSFRNFFHLIDSMAEQQFDKDQFEFIYVEQRSKAFSDKYNHQLDLKSLGDKVDEMKNHLNVRVVYLNQEESVPYQLGICNNAGISEAQGEVISVMDGDTLVDKNFLKKLTKEHKKGIKVLNLFRHMADYPIGVTNFQDWKKGEIDFYRCLEAAGNSRHIKKLPKEYPNKGPMISAKREFWEKIGYYDENKMWSTSASMVGKDTNTRLELATGQLSEAMPNAFCVHPWHPIGYARKGRMNRAQIIEKYFSLQETLINWSVANKDYSLTDRSNLTQQIQEENHQLIEQVIEEEQLDIASGMDESKLDKEIAPHSPLLKENFISKITRKLRR